MHNIHSLNLRVKTSDRAAIRSVPFDLTPTTIAEYLLGTRPNGRSYSSTELRT